MLNSFCNASEAWNSFDTDEACDSNDGMPSGGSLASWECFIIKLLQTHLQNEQSPILLTDIFAADLWWSNSTMSKNDFR